eukprot:s35_g2.t1
MNQAESQGFDLERALSQVILEEYPEDIGISRPDRQIGISRDAPFAGLLNLTVQLCVADTAPGRAAGLKLQVCVTGSMRRAAWLCLLLLKGAPGARMLEESLPFVLRRLRDRGVLSESQAQEALRGAAYVGRLPNILEACSELPAASDDALRGALAEDDADEMRLDYTLLDEGPCFVPNTKYMPANMPNEDRTVEELGELLILILSRLA